MVRGECVGKRNGGFLSVQAGRRRWPASFALAVLVAACYPIEQSALERIKAAGRLVILARVGPTTYYETPEGPAGFEYDLAKAFADSLGVKLEIVSAARMREILPRLLNGEADMAVGVPLARQPDAALRFTSPYQHVRQQLVYRLGHTTRPTSVAELVGRQIEVPAGTIHAQRLAELQREHPRLVWTESEEHEVEDLLQMVWEGLVELTVADADVLTVERQFFPELQVAFSFPDPLPLVWAFPPGEDDSLRAAAEHFLVQARTTGLLAHLRERYYGPASRSHFINLTVFRLRIQNRLPLYYSHFQEAAQRYGLDWRLLAAVGYQESYWDSNAVSPTGVRGLMMLTEQTAREFGIEDRHDPAASIAGGARLLKGLIERIPARIPEPDRLWMALAAYNIGLAHLEDARILTQRQGGDPDKWLDVQARLPLLEEPKWYEQTRHGYARGLEAVRFVNRVRVYYDVLVRLDEEEKARARNEALKLKAPAI